MSVDEMKIFAAWESFDNQRFIKRRCKLGIGVSKLGIFFHFIVITPKDKELVSQMKAVKLLKDIFVYLIDITKMPIFPKFVTIS